MIDFTWSDLTPVNWSTSEGTIPHLLDKLVKLGMKVRFRYQVVVRSGVDTGVYTVEIDDISQEGATLKGAVVAALSALNQKTLKNIAAEQDLVSALSGVL